MYTGRYYGRPLSGGRAMTEQANQPRYAFGAKITFTHAGQTRPGVVTHSFWTGNNNTCYHVKDEYGNYWHRLENEIAAVA